MESLPTNRHTSTQGRQPFYGATTMNVVNAARNVGQVQAVLAQVRATAQKNRAVVVALTTAGVAALLYKFYARYLRFLEPGPLGYLKCMWWIRDKNLDAFMVEHERLFREGKRTGDHLPCCAHWYSLMAELIATFFSNSFHLSPPSYASQPADEIMRDLHTTFVRLMHMRPGVRALDLGSGVGGLSRDLARLSGSHIVGVASSTAEVEEANKLHSEQGLDYLCHQVQGDIQNLPFDDNSFDCVFAVYCLKHLTSQVRALSEAHRVLKPGGKILIYCIMKSDKYDQSNPEHVKLVEDFEYSCGMPSLHSIQGTLEDAKKVGFDLVTKMDLQHGDMRWSTVFERNKALLWMLESRIVDFGLRLAELVLLPRRFRRFYHLFLANNVLSIEKAGRNGVMTGSTVLIFGKPK
eukprot:TRINITY_DN8659_c0_g1_i1.p1 TRINITY_DN8659_c0_g1~~TRINITY_DN8659_c0_g1_i1.p1  ORF type:complete len:407 (-),score=88.18 TRINITY_DN8659_c0_g1_i1:97-1317(-)